MQILAPERPAADRHWPTPDQNATPLTGCAAKIQAIAAQLEIAKSHGNSNQQAGLEKP